MKIEISKKQFDYLERDLIGKKAELFDKFQYEAIDQVVYIDLDYETADEIRDWAGEKQQEIGFDENYNLTEEGKILEEIIDTLYTG